MRKVLIATLMTLSTTLHALSPNEMLVVIGAVKFYNENCGGLTQTGIKKMNNSLEYFDMDNTPVTVLERSRMVFSGYQTAKKFGCLGTKNEANKAGYGKYIN